jgi:hypothetical protein
MAGEMGYEAIKLRPAEERFCHEYVLRNNNGTRAYLAVHPDVTTPAAAVQAHKLLRKDKIVARIEQVRRELRRKYAVTAEDIVDYHSRVMRIDRREYLDAETGKPKKVEDIDSEAASILELDCEKTAKGNIVVLFKVPSRHQSSVELARIMGIHKDGLKLTGDVGNRSEEDLQAEAERLALEIVAAKQAQEQAQ